MGYQYIPFSATAPRSGPGSAVRACASSRAQAVLREGGPLALVAGEFWSGWIKSGGREFSKREEEVRMRMIL